jgi:cell division initiation protein
MPVTPTELRHAKIATRLVGYDRAASDRLLEQVGSSYQEVWHERDALREEAEALRGELAEQRAELEQRTAELEQRTAELERELVTLRSRNEIIEDELARLRAVEQPLRETLVTAQNALDQLRTEAREQIEDELQEARDQAAVVVLAALERRSEVEGEIRDLEGFRQDLLASYRNLIEGALEVFEQEPPDVHRYRETLVDALVPAELVTPVEQPPSSDGAAA